MRQVTFHLDDATFGRMEQLLAQRTRAAGQVKGDTVPDQMIAQAIADACAAPAPPVSPPIPRNANGVRFGQVNR